MKYYIGLDIGGTKIKGVLVDEGYKMLKEEMVFTEGHKPKNKILQNIFSVIKTLKEGYNISGIGVYWKIRGKNPIIKKGRQSKNAVK